MLTSIKHSFIKYLPLLLIGFAISLVVKVPQIRDFAYSAYLEGMDLTHSEFGLLCSCGGIVVTLTYIVAGILCDYFDLRKLLVSCLVICALCIGFMATRPELLNLILSYCLLSFFGMSLFWCAAIKAVCIIAKNSQGKAFGLVEGVRGGTGLFFAAIAIIIMELIDHDGLGIATVLGYFAIAHLIVAVLLLKYLPADLKTKEKNHISFKSVKAIFYKRQVWSIIMMVFGIYTVFALMSYTGPYLENCGVPTGVCSFISAMRVFLIALVAAPIGGAICQRKGPSRVISVGAILCFALALALIFLDGQSITFVAISLVLLMSFLTFALKGIQFAALQKSGIKAGSIGLVLGLICTVGYSPEMFLFSLVGVFLDNFDEEIAYRLIFGLMAIGAVIAFMGAKRLVNDEQKHRLLNKTSLGVIFLYNPKKATFKYKLKAKTKLLFTKLLGPYSAFIFNFFHNIFKRNLITILFSLQIFTAVCLMHLSDAKYKFLSSTKRSLGALALLFKVQFKTL